MPVLPNKQLETINWVAARIEPWTTNATAIGLTGTQVTTLNTLLTNVQANVAELNAAKAAYESAQLTYEQNYQEMRTTAQAYINMIRSKAKAQDEPYIYVQASIPPPAKPTPSGIPPIPSDVNGVMNNNGFVELSWRGSTAYSTFFTIWRQLPGESDFSQIGTVGAKKFTDTTVPSGTTYASYRIYAHRGTRVSVSSEVMQIVFGVPQQQAA